MTAVRESIFDLIGRTAHQAGDVVSGVARLAVTEVGESAGSLLKGGLFITFGLGAALIGVLFLLHAGVSLLVQRGWSEASSYGLVGGLGLLLGLAAGLTGYSFMRGAALLPNRAICEIRALFTHKG